MGRLQGLSGLTTSVCSQSRPLSTPHGILLMKTRLLMNLLTNRVGNHKAIAGRTRRSIANGMTEDQDEIHGPNAQGSPGMAHDVCAGWRGRRTMPAPRDRTDRTLFLNRLLADPVLPLLAKPLKPIALAMSAALSQMQEWAKFAAARRPSSECRLILAQELSGRFARRDVLERSHARRSASHRISQQGPSPRARGGQS